MVNGIWLIFLAMLGVLIGLRPLAKPTDLGWVLVIFVLLFAPLSSLWGLWSLVSSLLSISWLRTFPIYWVTFFFSGVLQLLVSGLSTMRAIQSMGGKTTPDLRAVTVVVSCAALGLGVWEIAAGLIWTVS